MIRSFNLSAQHYASKWQVRDVADRNDRDLVNRIAFDFATANDPEQREKLQLQLIECFHGYLIKYFNMIVFGLLPALSSPAGKDAATFLKMFMPSGTEASVTNLRDSCKSLHLAYKEFTTSDEVYDALVLIFLEVCAHYDPLYTVKTKIICEIIERNSKHWLFRAADIAGRVEFASSSCLRVLVRAGFIQSVPGAKKTIKGYIRGPGWPPPQSFFESGPVGFVYFAQRFFRWYLRRDMLGRMGQVENFEIVFHLDDPSTPGTHMPDTIYNSPFASERPALVHTDGNWVDRGGRRWMADVAHLEQWESFDLPAMDDGWVKATSLFLFRTLEVKERYLLQLIYVREMSYAEISKIFDCNSDTVGLRHKQIMIFLENRARTRPSMIRADSGTEAAYV